MKNQCKILLILSLLAIIFSISESAPLESFSEGEKGYEAEEEKEVRVARLWDDMSVEVMKNGSLASPAIWPKGKVRYKIDPGFGNI